MEKQLYTNSNKNLKDVELLEQSPYLCTKHSMQSCFKFPFHLVQFLYTQSLKVFTSHLSTVSNSKVVC
jgi:hypothetical protein